MNANKQDAGGEVTNPDNVGGLRDLLRETYNFLFGLGSVVHPSKHEYVTGLAKRIDKAAGELCRAAPAGGDAEYSDRIADLIGGAQTPVVCEDGDANCTLWDILANAFGDDDIGNAREWLREEVYEAMHGKDSAPAGSGEVDGLARWWQAVEDDHMRDGLAYPDDHVVVRFVGKHESATLTAGDIRAALLRKLQQGAE